MDDHDLHAILRATDQSAALARRLADRDLFKRVVWAELEDVPDIVIDADRDAISSFEDEIATTANVAAADVILDIPSRPAMRESSARVVVGGEVRRLEEQSALVDALRRAHREQWRLGVYTPAQHGEPVGYAAEQVLGLDTGGQLVTERQGRYVPLDEFDSE